MLFITRKNKQGVVLNPNTPHEIVICILCHEYPDVDVTVGIRAPKSVMILREELIKNRLFNRHGMVFNSRKNGQEIILNANTANEMAIRIICHSHPDLNVSVGILAPDNVTFFCEELIRKNPALNQSKRAIIHL